MKTMDEQGRVRDLGKLKTQNEILFVLDSVGYQEFVKAKTPNFDRLGVTHKAYSPSFYTIPSVQAFLRGAISQPTDRCYWPYGRYSTVGEHNILPMSLSDKGYNTFMVSNNILINDVNEVDNCYVSYCPYFDNYIVDWKNPKSSRKLVKRFLNDYEEPFYSFQIYIEGHTPYLNAKGNLRRSNKGQILAIEYLDKTFGILLDGIKKRNNKYKTRIIVTADHSESWDKNNKSHKGHNPTRYHEFMKDGTLRRLLTVPLVIGYV